MSVQSLISKLSVFNTSHECVDAIFEKAQQNSGITTVGFLNQHGVNLALKNSTIHHSFTALDVLLRDGIGVKLAMKRFRKAYGANLNGTDLIPKIIQKSAPLNSRFYIFGTQTPWLELGAEKLLNGEMATLANGYQDEEYYLNLLKTFDNADEFKIIVLAMGMPKQESLALQIKEQIQGQGIVICGGAIIDFEAGRFARAPKWVQKLSLEWLFRLLKEPKRLFNRYVIGIPVFFYHLTKNP